MTNANTSQETQNELTARIAEYRSEILKKLGKELDFDPVAVEKNGLHDVMAGIMHLLGARQHRWARVEANEIRPTAADKTTEVKVRRRMLSSNLPVYLLEPKILEKDETKLVANPYAMTKMTTGRWKGVDKLEESAALLRNDPNAVLEAMDVGAIVDKYKQEFEPQIKKIDEALKKLVEANLISQGRGSLDYKITEHGLKLMPKIFDQETKDLFLQRQSKQPVSSKREIVKSFTDAIRVR